MTPADEPGAPARATVSDMDAARRRRERNRDARAEGAGNAAAKPAKRKRDPANRRFDAVKVERLKREIADGSYEIDCWSVADRFIEHERNRA